MAAVFGFVFFISIICLIVGLINPRIVLRWGEIKTRKRAAVVFGTVALISLVVVGYTNPNKKLYSEQRAAKAAEVAQQQADQKQEMQKQQEINKSVADQLKIKVEVQNTMDSKDNNKVVTWIRNESDYVVSGNVNVRLKDAANNTVDSDTVFIDKVQPKMGTYAISWLKAKQVTGYEYQVSIKEAAKVEGGQ